MGFFNLSYYGRQLAPTGPAGARSRAAGYDSRPTAANPLLAQIFTAVVGGTADDGTYLITATDDETGIAYTASFLRASGETNAQISAGLALNWNGKSPNNDIFTAAAPNATGTYTGKVAGRTYTITKSAPGTGTITLAQTQAAGGKKLKPGTFVARKAVASADGYTPDTVRQLATGDGVAKIWGFIERMQIMAELRPDITPAADETYRPGDAVPVMRLGSFWMDCETAFNALTDTPYVRINDGGDYDCVLRNDADGGDAIDASTILKVITGTAAAGRVEVHIDIKP